ncbi:hypothetical protein BDV38DRAFT_279292 [Aspergillus pseudotamarii]|uniref:EthD domain-containing protein n=1 Tax=Aspergillus pseudotamarii TaxID=132259 RepID=A0A5N6T518_ASPPS|nr:uncharacterized protein BDV38DRAFT_279292 [Aspergillus pseudotamarii]KAE8141392.1 hypothetical protein BDV38DRAFT_279292 [Aspergillus pseudotamarii]
MSSEQIFVQVVYPTSAASTFNMEYYLNHHIPLVKKRWGPQGLQSCSVVTGDKDAGYHVQATMVWKNRASYGNMTGVEEVRGDVKNFTDVAPYRWVGSIVYQEVLTESETRGL